MNAFANIVVIDIDARVPLDERQKYAAAQQRQVLEHFAPAWGRLCAIRVATPEKPPVVGEIQLRLLDKPTQDGALGYHDQLDDGTPIAYVFVGLARQLGEQWTTVASHEVLELLADPLLRRSVQTSRGFEAMEVCDAVEQDIVTIDGVALSNWCTPEYFEPPVKIAGVKFDYLGLCRAAGEVRPGGYSQYFDPKKGWQQVGEMSAYRAALAKAGMSRGSRRKAAMPRRSWWRRLFG